MRRSRFTLHAMMHDATIPPCPSCPWSMSQEVQCETGLFLAGARATIDSKEACEGVLGGFVLQPLAARRYQDYDGDKGGKVSIRIHLQLVTRMPIIQNTNDPIARTVRPYSK